MYLAVSLNTLKYLLCKYSISLSSESHSSKLINPQRKELWELKFAASWYKIPEIWACNWVYSGGSLMGMDPRLVGADTISR